MGLCRAGFVTTYMSDSLVAGFTTGAAVHVFTSQVKYALGLRVPRFNNVLQIVNVRKYLVFILIELFSFRFRALISFKGVDFFVSSSDLH